MDVTVRGLGDHDAEEFGRLNAVIDLDHPTPLRLTAAEFRDLDDRPGTRFFGAFAGGRMLAWSCFLASVQPGGQRFLLDGDHDPAVPGDGLADLLLETALRSARLWHLDTEPYLPVLFVNRAMDGRTEHAERVAGLGFAPERYRSTMVTDLDAVPEPAPLPEGFTLTTFEPHDAERLRAAHNEIFRDYPNGASVDEDTWAGYMLADHARHELSFVLDDDRGDVASYAFAHEYEVAPSGRDDHRELYFPYIGTARAHRGRGLAAALVARSLRAAAAQGFTAASLDVDSENPLAAHGVYARAGFHEHRRFVEYTLREPGEEQPA